MSCNFQTITSPLFSPSLTYTSLPWACKTLFLPGSPLHSCTHSSVLFRPSLPLTLSWLLVSLTHYALNFHICGSISTFFRYFPINSPSLPYAKWPKKFYFLSHIPTIPSGIQQLHCTTPLPLQPPILQAWPTLCPHTLQASQLCLPTRCTSLSSPSWSTFFFSALSLHPFFKRVLFLLLSPATHPPYTLGRKAYMSNSYLCHFHQPQPCLPLVTSLIYVYFIDPGLPQ